MESRVQARIVIAVLVVLIVLGLYGFVGITGNAVSEPQNSIKIGVISPITGEAGLYGENLRKGIDLSLRDSKLKNIKLIYEDSKCEPIEAVQAVNKLVFVDKVIAIIGDNCTTTLEMAKVANENNIPIISLTEFNESLNFGEYVFAMPDENMEEEFVSRYKAYYNAEPDANSYEGYSAFRAISTALKNGAKTGAAVKNELSVLGLR